MEREIKDLDLFARAVSRYLYQLQSGNSRPKFLKAICRIYGEARVHRILSAYYEERINLAEEFADKLARRRTLIVPHVNPARPVRLCTRDEWNAPLESASYHDESEAELRRGTYDRNGISD